MKTIRFLFCICLIVLVISACTPATSAVKQSEPTTSATEQQVTGAKYHKIGVLLLNSQVKRYFAIDVPNMKKVADAAGYELLIQSAEYDAKLQVSQAESVLTQGVDVVILQPADTQSASAIVTKANELGVPVVGYNDLPLNTPIKAFVGRSPYEAGYITAQAALKVHPKGNYVLIGGDVTNTVAKEYVKGWHDVLDPEVKTGNIKIVSDQYQPNWDAKLAVAQVENALTQNNNDIQVVLGNNDDLARGGAEAVKSAGLSVGLGPNDVYINGMDTADAMLQAIAEGTMGGSIWGSFDIMGADAATTAIAVVEGKEIKANDKIDNGWGTVPWVKAPVYLVTKENLADFVCTTKSYWVPMEIVYKNVPQDQWPKCKE